MKRFGWILAFFLCLFSSAVFAASAASPEGGEARAFQALNARQWKKAESLFLQALAVKPSAEAYEGLSRVQLEKGELDGAEENARRAAAMKAGLKDAYATLIAVYNRKGSWIKALEAADQAMKLDPQYARTRFERGRLYLANGLTEEAQAEFQFITKNRPDFLEVHLELGEAYAGNRQYREALQSFRKVLKQYPKNGILYKSLGKTYQEEGKNRQAKAAYLKAFRRLTQDQEIAFALGVLYYEESDFDRAFRWYLKAIRIDPEYKEAYLEMAAMARHLGKWKLAQKLYQKLLQREPVLPVVYSSLAYTYQKQGMTDRAISTYEAAIQANPELADNYYNLGIIFQEKKQYEKAMALYQKAVEYDLDQSAHYQYALGTAACLKGDLVASRSIYDKMNAVHGEFANTLRDFIAHECPKALEITPETPVHEEPASKKTQAV